MKRLMLGIFFTSLLALVLTSVISAHAESQGLQKDVSVRAEPVNEEGPGGGDKPKPDPKPGQVKK